MIRMSPLCRMHRVGYLAPLLIAVIVLLQVCYLEYGLQSSLKPCVPSDTPRDKTLRARDPATPHPISQSHEAIEFPRSLSLQIQFNLHAIVVQLQRAEDLKEEWSTDIEEQLVSILQQLDPKYEPPPRISKTLQSVTANSTTIVDFCPEHFVHAELAKPYFLSGSWLPVKPCPNVRPLQELVSVIVYWNKKSAKCGYHIQHLLDAIEQTHPSMNVFLALNPMVCRWENTFRTSHVQVTKVSNTWRPGEVWNLLAGQVKTPYVLVGRDLEDFSWLTHVRRQISILSTDPLVHVASGSVRNNTGHWEVGCYQSYLYNYILEYRDGYFSSKNECMYCDYVLGPFVTRTRTLNTLSFDNDLDAYTIFEDWFVRLLKESKLVMNCPDALYFATDPTISVKRINRRLWINLARKWQINRLLLPDDVKISFSCSDIELRCVNMYEFTKKQMMPICCMDQVASAMQVFHKLCVANGLHYSYIGGTTLGAVKFRGFVPWDTDGDAEYYAANLSFFREWGKKQKNEGKSVYIARVNTNHPGYFQVKTPEMHIEVFAANRTASDEVMPHVFKKIPTKMRIHGVWVYGPPNPGLYARNIYGKEILQHASSWLHTGKVWWNVPYTIKRHFMPCKNYGHHACTSEFNTDGSFQFNMP